MQDLYDTLGVDKSATPDDIKRAYRKQASAWHPDRNKDPEAPTRMQEITRAYAVLGDAESRDRYDRTGEAGSAEPAMEDRVEKQAIIAVIQLFDSIIEKHSEREIQQIDVVRVMRNAIAEGKGKVSKNRKQIRADMRKLRQVRRRLTAGNFIMHEHLRQKGRGMFNAWKQTRFDRRVLECMSDMVADAQYRCDPETHGFIRVSAGPLFGSTSATGW